MRYLSNTGPIFPPKKTHMILGERVKLNTLEKFDMESKNGGLEDDVPFQFGDF